MDGLYPSLQEKFKTEGICPICMSSMVLSPKYSCANDHTMCHRCKPYYFACPICRSPIDLEILPSSSEEAYRMPPAMHFMPHPYPPYPAGSNPSAPFMEEERHSWSPPIPTEDQELRNCGFSFAGCEVKFPEHLRKIHESRCQFRPNLEEQHLPTDLISNEETLINCRYRDLGCNVKVPEWRKLVHEENCHWAKFDDREENQQLENCAFSFAGCRVKFLENARNLHESNCQYRQKVEEENFDSTFNADQTFCGVDDLNDSFHALSVRRNFSESFDNPEETVECRYRKYGCMVKMPMQRRNSHEENCHWARDDDDDQPEIRHGSFENPDEKVACAWAQYGCRVTTSFNEKRTHEENCNYKMEYCCYRYRGCQEIIHPSAKYHHERNCEYA